MTDMVLEELFDAKLRAIARLPRGTDSYQRALRELEEIYCAMRKDAPPEKLRIMLDAEVAFGIQRLLQEAL